jgi:hypothetical protein
MLGLTVQLDPDRMTKKMRFRDHTNRRLIFLLSPANASGIRGQRLLASNGQSQLAQRLRQSGAPLAEVYEFISSLYFRGKYAYAEQFKSPPTGIPGVHIITGAGLVLPETVVTLDELRRISATPIDADNSHYRMALDRDLSRLREVAGSKTKVILMGSIATSKYLTPLLSVFGERLLFPKDFLGRGDMSRGSLLLRCCSTGSPLVYVPAATLAICAKKRPQIRHAAPALDLINMI